MSWNTEDKQNDLIPLLHTNRRVLPPPVFNLNSEGDQELLRAVFFSSWATGLPGHLDTRPFSTDSCICPLESRGWKYKLLLSHQEEPFSGNEGDSDFSSPLEAPIVLFLDENSHACQDLGWTHLPIIIEYNLCHLTTRNHGDRYTLWQLCCYKYHRAYSYNPTFVS